MCGAGQECGKCEVQFDDLATCKCRGTKPPVFPTIGKISWSGNIKVGKKSLPVYGEIQVTYTFYFIFYC